MTDDADTKATLASREQWAEPVNETQASQLDADPVRHLTPSLGLGLSFFFGSHGPDSGVADPSLDALINKGATDMDPTQRAADYKAVYAKLWANTYGDFLFENPSFNVQLNSVTGASNAPRWIDWGQVSVAS